MMVQLVFQFIHLGDAFSEFFSKYLRILKELKYMVFSQIVHSYKYKQN
jgi:uncharacterized membrane protein YwzB